MAKIDFIIISGYFLFVILSWIVCFCYPFRRTDYRITQDEDRLFYVEYRFHIFGKWNSTDSKNTYLQAAQLMDYLIQSDERKKQKISSRKIIKNAKEYLLDKINY